MREPWLTVAEVLGFLFVTAGAFLQFGVAAGLATAGVLLLGAAYLSSSGDWQAFDGDDEVDL